MACPYVFFRGLNHLPHNITILASGMKQLWLCLFLMISLHLAGQTPLALTGTVVDGSTGKPLPFAQLIVKGTTIGTSANNDGEFRLSIPGGYENDSLLFGYLGYSPAHVPIVSFVSGPLKVKMTSVGIGLPEVEVVGLTAPEVIRKAVENLAANYGRDSVLLTGYIRVQKIVGNKLAEYAEAIVQDLKDGYYAYPGKELRKKYARSNFPMLVKGRVKSDTILVNSMGDVGRQAFCLSCPFVLDIAEMYHNTALDEADFDKYDYRMKEIPGPDGKKIYHITYDQKEKVKETLYRGEIFISAENFAIMKVVYKPSMKAFDAYEKTKYNRPFTLRGVPGWIMEMPMGENVITYGERDGHWSLSAIRNDYAMVYVNMQSGKKIRYQYKMDLVVTDCSRDAALLRSFKGDKTLGATQRWDQLAGPVDEGFWQQYNYLPVEETLQKAVRDMRDQKSRR